MKVLHVAGIDPCWTRPGGTRSYVLGLICAVRKAGVDAKLLGARYGGGKPEFPFIGLRMGRESSSLFLRKLFSKAWRMRIGRGTVLHFHRPEDMIPFILFHPKNPRVVTLHGVPSRGVAERRGRVVGWLYRKAEAFSLKRADAVIAVSEEAARHCSAVSGRDAVVIPVGVDMDLFKYAPDAKARLGLTGRVVLLAGRFEKEKGVEDFAALAGRVDATLIAVGSGPMRKTLEDAGVRVVGRVDRQEMPIYYSAADVLVLPSSYEGMPTVMLEALACGTPVVAYDVGDVGKVTDGTCARIATQETLVEAIAGAMDGKLSREACRDRAMRFSITGIAGEVMKVYEEVSR